MAAALSVRGWPKLLQPVASRPFLVASALVGLAVFLFTAHWIPRAITRGLIGWDSGIALFVASSFGSMWGCSCAVMKQRSIHHDEGRHVMLLLTVVASAASVAAIISQLGAAHGSPAGHLAHVGLTAGTIALSWVFVQTCFAIHYAHVFYCAEEASAAHKGGLVFPGDEGEPDYWDFVYFAFVIGATSQTADVDIASRELRRIATLHGMTAFAFNTAILATMINLAAGLI
jgi:uncharacterized membrane protein